MAGTSNSGGRNAKPPQLHVVKGTFRSDRHGGHVTPEPPTGRPERPKPLNGEAAAEWERMVTRLETSKTLTLVDDAVLYQYAQLHAETERIITDTTELRRELERNRKESRALRKLAEKLEGRDLVDAIQTIVKLQKVMVDLRILIAKDTQQLRQGHMALRQYLVEFGMTPAARGRVKLPGEAKKKSKLDLLMGGAG